MFELPLEYALIEFKGNKFTGKVVPELLDLANRGIVRFVDIVFIQKEKDGNVRTLELNDLDEQGYREFVPIGKHVSSLFTTDDLDIAASRLKKNTAAALFLWENLWLENVGRALTQAGGKLVERAQISPDVVKQFKKELAADQKKQAAAKKKKSAAAKTKKSATTKKKK